jgi:hypothetical protein
LLRDGALDAVEFGPSALANAAVAAAGGAA